MEKKVRVKEPDKRVQEVVERSVQARKQRIPQYVLFGFDSKKRKGGFINGDGDLVENLNDAITFVTTDGAWLFDKAEGYELTLLQVI